MILDREERDVLIRRLLAARERDGQIPPGLAQAAAEGCGVHPSTVYRWLARPEGPGHTRYVLTERDKLEYFLACGNANLAYREMLRSKGPKPPSLSTYRRAIARELDSATQAAARHGAAARRQHRIALRGASQKRNQRWEADHTQLEIEIISPGATKPRRPWLTWVIDSATRYVGGWALSLRPTRGEVLAVLRLAIENAPARGPLHGRPDLLVWDNGLEFTANAVTDCALMIGSYAAPTFAYSPEKKPRIERINQTIERELLARLPFYTRGPRRTDGLLYGPPGGHLSLVQLVGEMSAWIDHYNFERPHSGLDGATPLFAWENDPTPIHEVSAEDLRRFTLERRTAVVSHDAGVTIDRRAFVAPELNGYVRKRVEVGMLPHDYSRAEIFSDGAWLCTAKPASELSHADILAHKGEIARLNAESGRLLAKRTKLLRERFAPMTAAEPEPRSLPPDPALRRTATPGGDRLSFGDEIGEVD